MSQHKYDPRGLTLLRALDGFARVRKKFCLVDGKLVESERPKLSRDWSGVETIVDDLASAMRVLKDGAERGDVFVPGALAHDLDLGASFRRKKGRASGDESAGATLMNVERHLLPLDLDTAPEHPGDVLQLTPEQVWSWVRVALPPEIRRADVILHLSSSFGSKPGLVKAHAFLWLDRPLDETAMRALLGDCLLVKGSGCLDASVLSAEHVIFLGDPIFDGCADPLDGTALEGRWFYLEGRE
jgi:hypothetical protein